MLEPNPESTDKTLPRSNPAIRPRVAVQCRDRLLGDALVEWCGRRPPLVAVGPAADAAALLALCRTHRPALVVLDIDDGAQAVLAALEQPRPYVIGLLRRSDVSTAHLDIDRVVTRSTGMPGFTKAVDDFLARTRTEGTVGTGYRLTPREREVLDLLGGGLHAADIALLLGLSPRTVENHQRRIYDKLGVHSGSHAVATAAGAGLLLTAADAAPTPIPLTSRERQILELADRGYSTKQIARTLCVSVKTVENTWRHLYGKLGVHGRAAALAAVHRWGP